MPQIPVFDSQRGLGAVSPNAPVPVRSFGRASAALGQAGREVSGIAASFAGGLKRERLDRQEAQSRLLAQQAEEIEKARVQRQKEIDDSRTKEAEAIGAKRLFKTLHDPRDGLFSTRGRQALGLFDRSVEALEGLRDEVAGGLDNDEQREMFVDRFQGRINAALQGTASHEAAEFRRYQEQAQDAVIEAAIDGAVASYTQPGVVESELTRAEFLIRQQGVNLPPEAVEQRVRQVRSKAHAEIVGTLTLEDPTRAAAYLGSVRGEIEPGTAASLDASIDRKREAAVREREQAQRREVSRAEKAEREEETASRREREAAHGDLLGKVVGGEAGEDEVVEALRQRRLSPAQAKELINFARDESKTRKKVKADPVVKNGLNAAATNGELDSSEVTDLLKAGAISSGDAKKLLEKNRKAKDSDSPLSSEEAKEAIAELRSDVAVDAYDEAPDRDSLKAAEQAEEQLRKEIEANPDASPAALSRKIAEDVRRSRIRIPPKPKYLLDKDGALKLYKSYEAIQNAIAEGVMTPEQAETETRAILDYLEKVEDARNP